MTPSPSLITNLRSELMRFAPFAQMAPAHVDRLVAECTQCYFEPGEVVLAPSHGVATQLLFIRRGSVSGRRDADDDGAAFAVEAGELFPIDAVMAGRAVRATYTAAADTFCLALPVASVQVLADESAPFADFLNRRLQQLLLLSQRALQRAYASQSLAEQSLETPLGDLLRRAVVTVSPATPLADALSAMHGKRIGSMLVADDDRPRHPDAPRRARPHHAAGPVAGHTDQRRDEPTGAQPGPRAHRAGRGVADVAPRHPPCAGGR
jgi:CBS domain-containing protein